MDDGYFLGAFEDLAPALDSGSSGGFSFDDGYFLGGYEDAAPAFDFWDQSYLGAVGGGGGLSALDQYFLGSNAIPEVTASSGGMDLGDWSKVLGSSGDALTGGFNAAKDSQLANEALGLGKYVAPAGSEEGFLTSVMKGMGLRGKDGTINLSDPKQLQAWMRLLMSGGGLLQALMQNKKKGQGAKSPQELLGDVGGGTQGMKWNPTQQASADAYFNSGVTPWNQRAMQYPDAKAPGLVQHLAHGGMAYADGGGAIPDLMAAGDLGSGGTGEPVGALGAVAGGQDDVIDARLAHGEYVWDADVVSALGDGDNDAGAAKLDIARQNIRKHKRSAPPTSIPPRAKPFEQYLPKGGK